MPPDNPQQLSASQAASLMQLTICCCCLSQAAFVRELLQLLRQAASLRQLLSGSFSKLSGSFSQAILSGPCWPPLIPIDPS